MTDTVPTVVQAVAAVMGHVQGIHKGDKNKAQGFSFRGIDSVMNAVGPALRTEGVVVLPEVIASEFEVVEVGKNRTRMQECRLEVRFTFHGPGGDTITCSTVGVAMDAGDKAAPKAHSVAFRTALLQALCIPTDEPDPDATVFERSTGRAVAEAKRELLARATAAGSPDATKLAAAVWKAHTPAGQRVSDDEWVVLTTALTDALTAVDDDVADPDDEPVEAEIVDES